jgi:hypothetical protein
MNVMKIPSSYRYYKLEDLERICHITREEVQDLLFPVESLTPSNLLIELLKRNIRIPMNNEKAKSELLVMPILVEMWEFNQQFKPLSGLTFNVDSSKGLKGVADFLISSKHKVVDLEAPIVCVFEAKDDKLETWYGQCGAEMYAARIFNEREGNDIKIIYGAITNGFMWQFLKLENQTLFIDSQRYGTANLPQLLGAIQKIWLIRDFSAKRYSFSY